MEFEHIKVWAFGSHDLDPDPVLHQGEKSDPDTHPHQGDKSNPLVSVHQIMDPDPLSLSGFQ